MHGASEQCMQATEIDFSAPTMPSLMVTTRRRLTPHGTSFSCLHAVTQPLHSMQRSASHRDRKSTRLNSSHLVISYAVFCLKKKKKDQMKTLSSHTEHHSQLSRDQTSA